MHGRTLTAPGNMGYNAREVMMNEKAAGGVPCAADDDSAGPG